MQAYCFSKVGTCQGAGDIRRNRVCLFFCENMFWGDRYGVLADPYGHTWSVSTRIEDVPDEEMQRRAAAFAGDMQKEIEHRRATAN